MPTTIQEGDGEVFIFDVLGVTHKTIKGNPSASVFVTAATGVYEPDKPETAAKTQKILALEEPFSKLKDPVLHVIADGKTPAGPELGNPDLSEDLLRSLAQLVKADREKWEAREEAWRARGQSQQWSLFQQIVAGVVLLIVCGVGVLIGRII